MKNQTEPTSKPSLVINPLSVGSLRLLRKMGLKISEAETEEAVQGLFSSMSQEEQEEEGTAFIWLLTRSRDELLPGGEAHEAITGGDWRRLVRIWEFDLDLSVLAAALAANRGTKRGRKVAPAPASKRGPKVAPARRRK